MSFQEVTDLIAQIKAKANALEFNEDTLLFDTAVGEIDYLCWKLRQTAWPRPSRSKLPYNNSAMLFDTEDLIKEILNDQ